MCDLLIAIDRILLTPSALGAEMTVVQGCMPTDESGERRGGGDLVMDAIGDEDVSRGVAGGKRYERHGVLQDIDPRKTSF